MAKKEASSLPPPTAEDLRVAAGHFEYANRATVGGNYDIAIGLLRTSCKLVPTNLAYRQALRKVEKTKYKGNLRGSLFAPVSTLFLRYRLWRARRRGKHARVLEHGEAILARNPWDAAAQLHMAEAASALGQPVLAIWVLQQAREKDGKDVHLNRALARLLEREGHFAQSIALWQLVHQAAPWDVEAQGKVKQLAASETIARGNYEEATAAADEATAGIAQGRSGNGLGAVGKAATPPPLSKATPVKKRPVHEEDAYRARIEADPTNPEPHLQLAASHRRNGRIEEAEFALKQGLASVGPSFELNMALADLEIEPLRRSLARAEEQLRENPRDEKAQRAQRNLQKEVNAKELAWYRRKAERDPADNGCRFELGVRLLRGGEVEEAIRELQASRSDSRLYWKAVMHLGHCFKAKGNWPLAKRNFEDSLRRAPEGDPARKDLLLQLALGAADEGDLPHAIELGLDLANMDYSYGDIGRLLDEWQGAAKPTRK
jgi:tetratricopeptide (TPR) repeat protein